MKLSFLFLYLIGEPHFPGMVRSVYYFRIHLSMAKVTICAAREVFTEVKLIVGNPMIYITFFMNLLIGYTHFTGMVVSVDYVPIHLSMVKVNKQAGHKVLIEVVS
jgi:hypothetical protein